MVFFLTLICFQEMAPTIAFFSCENLDMNVLIVNEITYCVCILQIDLKKKTDLSIYLFSKPAALGRDAWLK